MIRDEFPGTADGLAAACPEAMGSALHYYNSMTDAEKIKLHNEALSEFENEAKRVQAIWEDAQKALGPAPKEKKCRSKIDQIQNKIEILQHELVVENLRQLKNDLNRAKRLVKLEKTFQI
jgi:lipid II:glycine glycyltransferase (peptidoglycan interpeptide bridge formation enzyme)